MDDSGMAALLARVAAPAADGRGERAVVAALSSAIGALVGHTPVEVLLDGADPGLSPFDHPGSTPDRAVVELVGGGERLGEVRLHAHASEVAAGVQALVALAGEAIHAGRVIADLRTKLEELRQGSLHDPLTGLANRVLLVDRIEQALARSRRSGRTVGVIFCDLDRFKQVNDRHGHRVGDALLVAFAGRLRSLLRPGDTAARLGGDEFVVLCDELGSPAEATAIADRLAAALDDPFSLAAGTFHVAASLGVVTAAPSHQGAAALLDDADAAMYRAKRQGGRRVSVIDLRDGSAAARQALGRELGQALAAGTVGATYDPVVESVAGRPVSFRAVPTWERPEGTLAGAELRDLAVETAQAPALWDAVLRRACSDRVAWLAAGHRVSIAVPAGAAELLAPGVAASVAEVLDATGTEATALVVELTEDVIAEHQEVVVPVLDHLQQLGVALALDAYGTPRSSLGVLREVSFDEVKLDARVVGALGDPAGHATAFATVELAHLLGMVVVAVGVDSDEHLQAATMLGCDLSQGRCFGRRLGPAEVAGFLASGVRGGSGG